MKKLLFLILIVASCSQTPRVEKAVNEEPKSELDSLMEAAEYAPIQTIVELANYYNQQNLSYPNMKTPLIDVEELERNLSTTKLEQRDAAVKIANQMLDYYSECILLESRLRRIASMGK